MVSDCLVFPVLTKSYAKPVDYWAILRVQGYKQRRKTKAIKAKGLTSDLKPQLFGSWAIFSSTKKRINFFISLFLVPNLNRRLVYFLANQPPLFWTSRFGTNPTQTCTAVNSPTSDFISGWMFRLYTQLKQTLFLWIKQTLKFWYYSIIHFLNSFTNLHDFVEWLPEQRYQLPDCYLKFLPTDFVARVEFRPICSHL